MNRRMVSLAVAIVACASCFLLGHAVGREPDPGPMYVVETTWVNHATLIAEFFTWVCYPYVLGPICIALVVIAVRVPEWRGPIAFAILALLLAWRGADFAQHYFARPRRLDWIVKHETSFSYPSSHASIVTAFYLLWSLLIARSALAGRATVAVLVALVGFGIMWSRLALGAHYLTDILGGVLLGIAVVATLSALWPANVFEGRIGASLE